MKSTEVYVSDLHLIYALIIIFFIDKYFLYYKKALYFDIDERIVIRETKRV